MRIFSTSHPKKKYLYAVTQGKYLGEMWVYIEDQQHEHCFLALPEMQLRNTTVENFSHGLKHKIIDIVEKLPADVYGTCVKQYKKNKS